MNIKPDSITTLPGTLPGLMRRGAPGLLWVSPLRHPVLVANAGRDALGRIGILDGFNYKDVYPEEVALDLTDPAGRDVAARWAAERLGLAVGATAPMWFGDRFGWGLSTSAKRVRSDGLDEDWRKVVAYFYHFSRPHFSPAYCHYGIDGIDTDDAITTLALACLSLATI